MDEGAVDHAVHQLQTGVAAYKNLLGLAVQNVCEQALCLRQTGQSAVIADVDTVNNVILRLLEHVENIRDHIQLVLAGLAAGHVQLESLCLQVLKGSLKGCVFRPPLVQCHVFVSSHLSHPLRVSPKVGMGVPHINIRYIILTSASCFKPFPGKEQVKYQYPRKKFTRSFHFAKNML